MGGQTAKMPQMCCGNSFCRLAGIVLALVPANANNKTQHNHSNILDKHYE